LLHIPNAGNVWYVNVPHNIECGRFFVVQEILYLHAEFLFGAANFFFTYKRYFQTLVMDKMYLLAYEIHVKITTFYKRNSNKGVYRLRGAGIKITENR